MDRIFRPERFDTDPTCPDAAKQWNHWRRTFLTFLSSIEHMQPNKLDTLITCISASVYESIADCETYESAMSILESLYVRPTNEIFARYRLFTCKQDSGQNLDQFLQKLKSLAKDCNFRSVTAEQNRNDAIRDAFINGIESNHIRQRLLEHTTLDLAKAFDTARSLEMAEHQSLLYRSASPNTCGATSSNGEDCSPKPLHAKSENLCAISKSLCFFVGMPNIHVSTVLPEMLFVSPAEKGPLPESL